VEARPYQTGDDAACLAILRARGLASEEAAWRQHLDPARYFVLEHDGVILGCGGVEVRDGVTYLVWGMIDPAWERRGLGRLLLLYRSRGVGTEFLDVETPAAYAPFYERAGFRRAAERAGLVTLRKRMTVCS